MKNIKKSSLLKKIVKNNGRGGPGMDQPQGIPLPQSPKSLGSKIADAATSYGAAVRDIPGSVKNMMKGGPSDTDVQNTLDVVRQARGYKGAPDYDDSGKITDAFKTRTMKRGMVNDYLNKVKNVRQ